MAPILSYTSIAVGKSGDGTEEKIEELNKSGKAKLKVISTTWDDQRTDRGYIFSEQTNIALNQLREDKDIKKLNGSAWAICLQSDEVFHEADLEQIKKDIQKAEDTGCDVVRFRYLHFWQSHNKIAINKKWYPQEIRALRIHPRNSSAPKIVSTGDAQSFGGWTKAFESDCHVYHYGHVREQKAYAEKMDRMIRYYHPGEGLARYIRKWHKKDRHTETLNFFGDHPEVMRERIARLGGVFEGKISNLDELIVVDKTHPPKGDYQGNNRGNILIPLNPSCWDRILHPFKMNTSVPKKMRSKFARPWPKSIRIILMLSEKGLGPTKNLELKARFDNLSSND
jgi:hypothetical protein